MLIAIVMGAKAQDFNPQTTPLTFEAIEPASIFFMNNAAGPVTYRVNDGEVQTIESGEEAEIELDNSGDKVSFYGDNKSYRNPNNGKFSTIYTDEYGTYEGHFYVYGNIMSLVNSTSFATATMLTDNYAFARLFYYGGWNNPEMESHPTKDLVLPATTLTAHCYEGMFYGCTGLTRAPVLPATTLAEDCYARMFMGCTGLTSAPALPVIRLAEGCYASMFQDCTGLTSAPDLLAPTLEDDCYERMFDGCSALNSVKCLAGNITAYGCTYSWLADVSETGTFTMGPGVSWESGENGIPTGWTIVKTNEMMVIPKGFYKASLKTFEYWTTFYNSVTNFKADENTSVYTASFDGEMLKLKKVEDGIIRAGQGVILISKNAIITLTSTTMTGTESYYDGNELLGSDTDVTQDGTSSYYIFDMYDYVLDEEEEEEPEFRKVYGDIPAQVVYVKISGGFNEDWLSIETDGEAYLAGDANGDSIVNVADIVEIVNYLNNNPSAKFNEKNADADGSNGVTIEDINAIVNIILDK